MKSLCLSLCVRCSVFGEEPDLTREGGSIPVTLTLEEVTGRNVMLLPIGACDDGAHSQNEKINRCNYIKGVLNAVHHYCLVISRDVKSSASGPKKLSSAMVMASASRHYSLGLMSSSLVVSFIAMY